MTISERTLVLGFRIILVLLLVSTLNALRIYYFIPDRFDLAFPGAVGFLRTAFLTASYLGLIALVGLLFLKRWALYTFITVSIAAIVLDVMVSAPLPHQAAVVLSSAVVGGFALRLRTRFSVH